MSSSQHGVAGIGLGTVGLRYVEQFQLDDRFVVVGGFDASPDAAAAAAERFGIDVLPSAEALIADERVDVVYVAVPPGAPRRLRRARGRRPEGTAVREAARRRGR
ncbi:MAG: Gfo/Idh/MocA family oxidoreductase [Actinomycetota bacterium]